jgi:hypothetical protein
VTLPHLRRSENIHETIQRDATILRDSSGCYNPIGFSKVEA